MLKKKYKKRTGTKRLKTDRLTLRKILPTDFLSTVKWYTKPEMARFMISKSTPSKWEIWRFITTKLRKYFNKSYYSWAIVYKGKMRGYIELMPSLKNENVFYLSYKLDLSINNLGLMTEALKSVIEYAKTQGILGIVGTCDMDNIASKRVMEKAGMIQYGSSLTNVKIDYADGTHARRLTYKIKLN